MTCHEGVMPKIRYDLEDMRDNSANFPKEVKFLMHKYGCARRDIVIDSQHPCGEDVIFNGKGILTRVFTMNLMDFEYCRQLWRLYFAWYYYHNGNYYHGGYDAC